MVGVSYILIVRTCPNFKSGVDYMKFDIMHPADQIVAIMNRIYENGLTTTSGGNRSILEENGDIWITPGYS